MEVIAAMVGIAIFFLFMYVIVRGIATTFSSLTGRRFRAYRALAKRYRGKYEPRGLGEAPTVSFVYNGASVRVGLAPSVQGQPNTPRTRVVARFAKGIPLRMELTPSARLAPPQSPRGTRKVAFDDPVFDRGYVVHANDPEMAQELFQAHAKRAVENLRRMAPPTGMLVSVNPERLLTQVDRNLAAQPELLEHAVRESLVLLDALLNGVDARLAQGITIQSVGPAAEAETGLPVCKICGEPIEHEVRQVVCAACKTPHHADCWEFTGGCSVFGCQGKRAIAV